MSTNDRNNDTANADRFSRPDRPRRPERPLPAGSLSVVDVLLMSDQVQLHTNAFDRFGNAETVEEVEEVRALVEQRRAQLVSRRDELQLEVFEADRELLLIAARIAFLRDGFRVADRNGLLIRTGDVVRVYDDTGETAPFGLGLVTDVSAAGVDVNIVRAEGQKGSFGTFTFPCDCVAKAGLGLD